jgi:sugar phosphate isomerase/epimerase
MMKKLTALMLFAVLCSLVARAPAAERPPLVLENPLFAFDNGVGRGQMAPAEQAALLKELGYDGIGYTGATDLPTRLAAFDEAGLKVFSIYVNVMLKPSGYDIQFDVPKTVEQLKGHGTTIWLTIRGNGGKKAEESAVAAIRKIADAAAPAGLRVVLYPHAGFYVDTTGDGTRLAEKSGRDNVGTTLNLCHWLKVEPQKPLEEILDHAGDRLMMVSINGAEKDGRSWQQLIQPLDSGNFDVYGVLAELKSRGYTGPIGIQCYNVPGPPREKLTRSMAAWRAMVK